MSPEISKTPNIFFPYLLMEGYGATLLTANDAKEIITALARNSESMSEDIKQRLDSGDKIQFAWSRESEPTNSSSKP
jgi:hypothetical protein